jgi:hypothetical protein
MKSKVKKTYIILFIACFVSCSVQKQHLKQIKQGLNDIPTHCIDNRDKYCQQLNENNNYYRNLIAKKIAPYVLDSDSIIFIEESLNNVIGGYQTCYVYLSKNKQIKCYKTTFMFSNKYAEEYKTYTIEELKATLPKPQPAETFPSNYSKEMIEELNKGIAFPMRDIIFSIQANSLDSCIAEIGKLCYTPSSAYDIVIAIRADEKYVFQYYSASMCEKE